MDIDPAFLNILLYSSLVAGVSSAVISAISNWLFFSYRFRKEGETGFIQARAELYSRLFFWLKIWQTVSVDIHPSWEEFGIMDKFVSARRYC